MTDEQIFSMMLHLMMDARKNKRYGKDCSVFEIDWAPKLIRMMRRLKERTFRIDHNYAFLTSIPKWREIFATFFEGRIADYLLCDILSPYIEKELHPRTFNNRKGMGGLAAINQVIEDIYEVSNGYAEQCRIIKWDLKGFFPSAQCDVIERCFDNLIDKNKEDIIMRFGEEMPNFLKWLAMICVQCCPANHCERRTAKYLWDEHIEPSKSLFNKEPGIGTPIGRLTSQTGMGLYLNDEIRWLNHDCGIHSTLFMDDCVMIVPERLHDYALSLFDVLRERLAAKGIKLNEKKFYDQPYQHGLEFLGSHIKPYRLHINNATYSRALSVIFGANDDRNKYRHLDHFVCQMNSYIGMLKNETDYKRINNLINGIDSEWWRWIEWNKKRLCVSFRKGFTQKDRLNLKYNLKIKQHDKSRNSSSH